MIFIDSGSRLVGHVQRSPWQRAMTWVLPPATLMFSLIFGAVPLTPSSWAVVVPDFLAPTLFFWCIHRPNSVPILLAFLLGLCADTMHDTPMGVQALAYMLLAMGTKTQSQHLPGLGVLFHWGIFALAMIGFGIIKFCLSLIGTPGVFDHSLVPAILRAVQLVLTTIVAYLGFHLILGMLSRGLLGLRPTL